MTLELIRPLALSLPRTTEHLIRDRVKFRIRQIVYLAFSRDETVMGFAFPKDEREALVDSRPETFVLPSAGDLRYHWVHARLDSLDWKETQELVIDAWCMCVPKSVAVDHLRCLGLGDKD